MQADTAPVRRASATSTHPSVVVATDKSPVSGLVIRMFERAGYRAVETTSGEETLRVASKEQPILVVLDLDAVADISGYQVYHELRERLQDRLMIILLSGTRTDPEDRLAGLLIGADDYVTKPFEAGEIVARAQRLLARRPNPAPRLEAPLTRRELQVLALLANGFSQEKVARELFISRKTVGTHIQRMLTKLGVHSRTEAVAVAYKYGLMQAEPPSEI